VCQIQGIKPPSFRSTSPQKAATGISIGQPNERERRTEAEAKHPPQRRERTGAFGFLVRYANDGKGAMLKGKRRYEFRHFDKSVQKLQPENIGLHHANRNKNAQTCVSN
jgi:hypothetical protein